MKDSGVEWIGEIPNIWNLKRFKYALSAHSGGAWGDVPKNDEKDMICLRVADFNYKYLNINYSDLTIRNYQEDIINKLVLKKGDILLEKSGGGENTPVGRSVIFDRDDINCLFANFIERLSPAENQYPQYVNYWLSTAYTNGLSKRNIKQTTGIQNLDVEAFLSELFPEIDFNEQQAISTFLDHKCAEIDSVICVKQRQNELLKEQRQSEIYQAVTKGLNKNAAMKDSSIEWIGSIPEGWSLEKLKYNATLNPNIDISKYNLNDEDDVSFIPMENLKNGYHTISEVPYEKVKKGYVQFEDGDILIAKVTPCFENGNLAIAAGLESSLGFGSTEINVVRAIKLYNKYLYYYFQNKKFIERGTYDMYGVAGLKRVTPTFLLDSFYPKPPYTEQLAITEYLNVKCAEIDRLIQANNVTIEKLKEYRQSVIYEAVTGKTAVS